MKESRQTINQLLNKRSKSINIDSLSDSSQIFFDKQRMSDKMNQFFCSFGKTPHHIYLITNSHQFKLQNLKYKNNYI